MTPINLGEILNEIEALRSTIVTDSKTIAHRWAGWIEDDSFHASAMNFSHYLALRRQDIRPLQERMSRCGLSSLGRAEGRVIPTLDAVANLLRVATGQRPHLVPLNDDFYAGAARISARSEQLFGRLSPHSPVSLLVTLPSEAAEDPDFALRLAGLGVEAVRINCAHDNEAAWDRMIANVEKAAEKSNWRMKVLMDLAGPKLRTGALREVKGGKRIWSGDELAITLPGELKSAPEHVLAIECTDPRALRSVETGNRVLIDDGKVVSEITQCLPWGVMVRIVTAPKNKGYKLKSEKGLNFPDTDLEIDALTPCDIEALSFIAHRADGVEYSFVQTPEDVALLQSHLARERPHDWQKLGLVLKIETEKAIRNLPDMIVRAAGRQPTAVMIARGDLAAEIGFARLAEMQEEILWLCEAAQVPVIWATQVLEGFVKTGIPSRGEMTDAAMAARAECVMLNKGPHLFEVISELDKLIARMSEHMQKKSPQLRPLKSW
ncbi:pyruvate kinase [Breoghania sp.]|uniref:pyruvate kinase n=1 Tax=Breoghania sp. TaxID=2065378 RepID=UPI002AA685AE|nr:pyruvate kinase [Breoghania sp.]